MRLSDRKRGIKLDTTSQQCLLKGTLRWVGWIKRYFSAMFPERDIAFDPKADDSLRHNKLN